MLTSVSSVGLVLSFFKDMTGCCKLQESMVAQLGETFD